jgi:flagellar biosynthesis GTPase FlhF
LRYQLIGFALGSREIFLNEAGYFVLRDGPDCRWVFSDSSRSGRRKWCDMNTCGNRAKAARLLGTTETVGALAQSIKDHSRKELILIDTPGYSEMDFDLSGELARFLSTYPHVDVHLVLSCAAKSSDISHMVDRYNIFGPAKLLFTRLDETRSYGAIFNESIRTGLPVSFLGLGSRVPDDLELATKDRLIDLLLEGRQSRAVATS